MKGHGPANSVNSLRKKILVKFAKTVIFLERYSGFYVVVNPYQALPRKEVVVSMVGIYSSHHKNQCLLVFRYLLVSGLSLYIFSIGRIPVLNSLYRCEAKRRNSEQEWEKR